MNKKLRELAKESDLDWHKHWNDDESNRLEKFAELIVKECAGVELYWLSEQDRKSVAEKIKSNFGVRD